MQPIIFYSFIAITICVYFHRVVIMFLLSPITAWATHIHKEPLEKRRSLSYRLANKYCWWFERLFLYWVGQIHSHRIRNYFYRYAHRIKMGKNVVIYAGAEIRNPGSLTIGDGTIIGDNAILDARAGLEIGSNVNFSSNVSIWTLQHDYRDPNFACNPEHYGPVKIEDRAWIGPHTIILRNVTVGEGSVVAAGATVTKDIPKFELWGGVPAKRIGLRPNNLQYVFRGSYCHFL